MSSLISAFSARLHAQFPDRSSHPVTQLPGSPPHLFRSSPRSGILGGSRSVSSRNNSVFRSFVLAAAREPAMATKLSPDLHMKVFSNSTELSKALADHIQRLSQAAVEKRGAFSVVLSGGSLVASLGKLVESPWVERIDWSRWHVFWVDERVVKKDDPDSSYKLAHDLFLSKVAIPVGQVYSINDALDAQAAAEEYESVIKQAVRTGTVDATQQGVPRFDLILLGMGPDGHVASLFPGHPLVKEKEKLVAWILDSPKPPPKRITMTFPVVNSAANVVFVATGSGKADMLEKVFHGDGELPAGMVLPVNGKLSWFVDEAAAAKV